MRHSNQNSKDQNIYRKVDSKNQAQGATIVNKDFMQVGTEILWVTSGR